MEILLNSSIDLLDLTLSEYNVLCIASANKSSKFLFSLYYRMLENSILSSFGGVDWLEPISIINEITEMKYKLKFFFLTHVKLT